MAILDQKLHRRVLRRRIRHLLRDIHRPHDRRRKHGGNIQRRHEILLLAITHAVEVKDQKLKTLAMSVREFLDGGAQKQNAAGLVVRGGGVEEFVVDGVRDERGGEPAEVLFQGGGDSADVEIGVGDVKVVILFEAFFDHLDLRIAAGFAVDAFQVHPCSIQNVSAKFYARPGYTGWRRTSCLYLLNTASDNTRDLCMFVQSSLLKLRAIENYQTVS